MSPAPAARRSFPFPAGAMEDVPPLGAVAPGGGGARASFRAAFRIKVEG
jgi:hypothetical protein